MLQGCLYWLNILDRKLPQLPKRERLSTLVDIQVHFSDVKSQHFVSHRHHHWESLWLEDLVSVHQSRMK